MKWKKVVKDYQIGTDFWHFDCAAELIQTKSGGKMIIYSRSGKRTNTYGGFIHTNKIERNK
jgi:hypothetical protein